MNFRNKLPSKILISVIILLTLLFFIKLGANVTKSIDKSKLATEFIASKSIEFFSPSINYIYWGDDNSFIKQIIDFFFPAGKLIYEEASKETSTTPAGYLTYYNAIKQSEATGEAVEAVTEHSANAPEQVNSLESIPYTLSQLADYSFLINEFYTVDRTTYVDETLINSDALLNTDLRIDKEAGDTILIYHTHSQEAFADSNESDPSTSIVAVGQYLAKLLSETYGFNVIHNTKEYDIAEGKLDRNKAYTYAEDDLKKILEENPQIKVIIDLHRDGVDGEKMTTNINGKETARIMFFNGLSRTVETGEIESLYNPNLSGNLAMSFQAQLVASKKYPELMRRIYLKGYQYNLHFMPRSLLIEAGSQKNTFQEMLNAMEPLADVLNEVLTKEFKIE